MKKLLFILCVLSVFVACSDDNDNETTSPIENLKMPSAETIFTTGQSVTIEGNGFTTTSQIWLRTATKATEDIQTNIIEVTDNSITFEVPEGVGGKQSVILKQGGKEYELGVLQIQKHPAKFYTFCYDDIKNELAEINLENGQLIWTGIKIPEYEGNGRGETFDEINNDFIAFEPYPARIHKINMDTKIKETIILEKENEDRSFNEIIKSDDNKFYAFCYNNDKNEFAELDIKNEQLIWTGIKIPEYKGNGRGELFDKQRNEFIVFELYSDPVIYRANANTKAVKTIPLKNLNGASNFNNIFRSSDNKYYVFCYDQDKMEFAEINIESGNLTWTGIKIPDSSRGELIYENEFIAFDLAEDAIIYKANMSNKEVKTIKLGNLNGASNFNNILKR